MAIRPDAQHESAKSAVVRIKTLNGRLNNNNNNKERTVKKMSTPTFTTYKGHKLIVLNPGERFRFQFGQAKAKLIVENYEAIKAFANGGQSNGGDAFDKQVEDNMREACGA